MFKNRFLLIKLYKLNCEYTTNYLSIKILFFIYFIGKKIVYKNSLLFAKFN